MCLTAAGVGNVPNGVGHHKRLKYSQLDPSYVYIPRQLKHLWKKGGGGGGGGSGFRNKGLFASLGKRIREKSGDPRSHHVLKQRVSVEVQ